MSEHLRMAARTIISGQRESFEAMQARDFEPQEITRSDNTGYSLPQFIDRTLFLPRKITFDCALREIVQKKGLARVLDIGCGAGFWSEDLLGGKMGESIEVFGITGRDYRRTDQRPPVEFSRMDEEGRPMFQDSGGRHIYIGYPLDRNSQMDNEHYVVGDIHEVLGDFEEASFDIAVSYQACRYLFDPLRVLKQVYRTLDYRGFAFLESFQLTIFTNDREILTPKEIKGIFAKNGYDVSIGYYEDYPHTRSGLSLRKTKPRLHIPSIVYNDITYSEKEGCKKVTYAFNQ